jgi:hypothetical protein
LGRDNDLTELSNGSEATHGEARLRNDGAPRLPICNRRPECCAHLWCAEETTRVNNDAGHGLGSPAHHLERRPIRTLASCRDDKERRRTNQRDAKAQRSSDRIKGNDPPAGITRQHASPATDASRFGQHRLSQSVRRAVRPFQPDPDVPILRVLATLS